MYRRVHNHRTCHTVPSNYDVFVFRVTPTFGKQNFEQNDEMSRNSIQIAVLINIAGKFHGSEN